MPAVSGYLSLRSRRTLLISGCVLLFFWGILLFGLRKWSSKSGIIGFFSPFSETENHSESNPATSSSKNAFATILTGEGDIESNLENPYFMAARLLAYQLLHSPDTRSTENIPLLVLVTENIPQEQRDVLTQDGAIIVPVESITRDWIHPKWDRWSGVLAKLNIWKMTEYEKIAFLDADSILFHPIDGIFTEQATAIQKTKTTEDTTTDDSLPASFMIAGIHDLWVEQNLPPIAGKEFYVRNNYMNAGFFILSPSEEIFNYYLTLLDTPGAFDPNYPEQNLLNCAHRVDGRMPWSDIGTKWNQKSESRQGYDSGLRSIHHKWWKPLGDPILDGYIANVTAEMRSFIQR